MSLSQRPELSNFHLLPHTSSSFANPGHDRSASEKSVHQIAQTQTAAPRQRERLVPPTQTFSADHARGHVRIARDSYRASSSRVWTDNSRGRPEHAQPRHPSSCTRVSPCSRPSKRKRRSTDRVSLHSGGDPNVLVDRVLDQEHHETWSGTGLAVPLQEQYAHGSSQSFRARALALEETNRLFIPHDLADDNASVVSLPFHDPQTTEALEHVSDEGHYFFTPEIPHTAFSMTNWSPSLDDHAAAAGVFAAGDSLSDLHCFDSNPLQTPYDTSLNTGPAGVMIPTTSAGTPRITAESQYYSCTDIPVGEQGFSVKVDSSEQNDAHTASAQHDTQYLIICPECGKRLTGRYCKRNAKRHLESVHKKKVCYCDVDGCNRAFNRSDAVLVHKRRSHVAIGPPFS